MSEKTFEIRQIGIDYICDSCGSGLMEQTGIMLLTDPPKWSHKCNKCGDTKDFLDKYPTVRFERKKL